jgi:hypothetical protein
VGMKQQTEDWISRDIDSMLFWFKVEQYPVSVFPLLNC